MPSGVTTSGDAAVAASSAGDAGDAQPRGSGVEGEAGVGDRQHDARPAGRRIVGDEGRPAAARMLDPPRRVDPGKRDGAHRAVAERLAVESLDVGRRAVGDGEVEVGLGEIDAAVGRLDGEAHLGVGRAVRREPRAEPLGGEIARRGDRQDLRPLRVLEDADRLLEGEETAAQRRQRALGLGGEFEVARHPLEQDGPQHVLERADLLADRGGRHGELVGRLGERQVPRGGVEHAQRVERKVGPFQLTTRAPDTSSENSGIAISNSVSRAAIV